MSTLSNDTDAVRLSTGQVLDWMANFTDSKEDIRVKIMTIVRENDLDGHALKQLRDDPDELHDLLPILKERLTFRAMTKRLYGPISSSARQNPSNSRPAQSNLTHSVSAARQSPTQLPSTSLESPPPPACPQVSQLRMSPATPYNEPENQTSASSTALPAFSSFHTPQVLSSSSQQIGAASSSNPTTAASSMQHHDIIHHSGVAASGQSDVYRGVYPTGIISDDNRQSIDTSQSSSMYCGQSEPVCSAAMNPINIGSSNYQYTYSDLKLASTSTPEPSLQPSSQSEIYDSSRRPITQYQPTAMATGSTVNDYRRNVGTWKGVRGVGLKYTKAHVIAQKYKKDTAESPIFAIEYRQGTHTVSRPLPTFSPILRHQIEIGNIMSFKTRFVYECAQYYMSIDPTPTHAAYRNISMTIIAKFPELADQNNVREPWRPFNTSLSQAIRNIRRRLRSVPGTGFPPVEPRYQHLHGKRFTPNQRNVNNLEQNTPAEQPSSMNMHDDNDVTVVSTNETSETVLIEDDDPLESVDMPDETTVESEDTDYTEKKEIVIKMEEFPSNEEDDISKEWSNEKT